MVKYRKNFTNISKKFIKMLLFVLCISVFGGLFNACNSGGGAETGMNPTAGTNAENTPVPEATPVPEIGMIDELGLVNVGRDVTGTAEEIMNRESDAEIIYVNDYGAVGDGDTNDAKAVTKAINALKKAPAGSTLQFEANSTYYLGKSGTALTLNGISDKIIQGSNTTILIDAPAKYLDMTGCKNTVLSGLNFNYNKKPYAFSVSIDDCDSKHLSATITLDRSLGIKSTFSPNNPEFFGVLNREDGRYHISITKIEVVDESKFQYKFTFGSTFADPRKRVEALSEYGIIVPVPGIGHSVEQALTIVGNTDIMFKDCNVWSACKFMCLLRNNEGKVLFDNFNVTPDPAENGGNIRIVGWRDGFHCKENRAQLIWKDCRLEWVYDDVFNISCSMLRVKSVSGEGADAKITLTWPETGGAYGLIRAGDTVSFYDVSRGEMLGTTTVKKASGDRIVLDSEIKGIKEGTYVAVNSLGAPNSQIINCDIKGTLRFRSPMYIVDSRIHCTRMWLAFEQQYLEGPLPQNILFHNCDITFDDSEDDYIEIYSSGSNIKSVKNGRLTADEALRVKNIIFEYCNINTEQIKYGDVEEYFDDTVKVLP